MKVKQFLDSFWLKVIAMVTMTVDHIGLFLIALNAEGTPARMTGNILRDIGRISMPLFVFLLAEGMKKTHDRGNYILRLSLMWAPIFIALLVLNSISFSSNLGFSIGAQAFTDLVCYALFIFLIEKKGWWKLLAILPVGYIGLSFAMQVSEVYCAYHSLTCTWTFIPEWARCGYSLYGFLMFLGMYYFGKISDANIKKKAAQEDIDMSQFLEGPTHQGYHNALAAGTLIGVTVIFWLFAYLRPDMDIYNGSMQTYAVIAALPIIFYNGKRGYDAKWWRYFTYLYYPVHLVLIAAIFVLSYGLL